MSTHKGRQCRVEIASTFGSAKTVSAVTKALPAAITSTAHGLTDGTIGYFDTAAGMDELLGQAASVNTVTTNAFEAEGLDSTSFGTFTSGTFTPATAWVTLSNATQYEIGGGAAEALDATTLLDNIRQEQAGLLPAQTVTFTGLSDSQLAAVLAVRAAALNNGYILVRITCSNGERRVFRGQPSLPSESLGVNQLATGSFDVKVKGQVLFLPAA